VWATDAAGRTLENFAGFCDDYGANPRVWPRYQARTIGGLDSYVHRLFIVHSHRFHSGNDEQGQPTISHAMRKGMHEVTASCFHPDFTVGPGVTPDQSHDCS
jgi:hypothetical protein